MEKKPNILSLDIVSHMSMTLNMAELINKGLVQQTQN
jgi:hypothetical protein